MELDDMKETWLNLNKKLEHQQVLNEKLIQQIAKEQSNNRLNKIIKFEISGQFLNLGLLLYIFPRYNHLDSTMLQVSVWIIFLAAICLACLSYVMYQKISKIDIQKHALVDVLNAMTDFKIYYYKYKKWEMIVTFIEVIFLIPIIVKLVHHKNVLEHLSLFGIPIIVGLSLGFAFMFLIYKHLYEKNIEAVEMTLEDLKELGK